MTRDTQTPDVDALLERLRTLKPRLTEGAFYYNINDQPIADLFMDCRAAQDDAITLIQALVRERDGWKDEPVVLEAFDSAAPEGK